MAWGKKLSVGEPDNPQQDFRPVIEVIPPWEVMPLPVDPSSPGDVYGIIRHRLVPLSWLKSKDGLKPPKGSGWDKLETHSRNWGEQADAMSDAGLGSMASDFTVDGNDLDSHTGDDGRKDGSQVSTYQDTWLSEVYIWDYDETLLRYIVYAGGEVLSDVDWSEKQAEERPMKPIAVFHDIPTGGFHGKGFASMLMPSNMELEHLLKSQFENCEDIDTMGVIMCPTSQGINIQQFKRTAKPRIVMYEPDLSVPEHKPYVLAPMKLGPEPLRLSMALGGLMDDLSGQSSMMQGDAPGRVDSASGLGFLWETGSIPLAAPMESLAQAFITVYKAFLGMARTYWPKERLARLTMLDDALVGVVLDPATGKIKLGYNAIPHPTTVTFKVRSQLPKSRQQQKMELQEMLDGGLITPRTYRRLARIQGLDLPLGDRAEFEAWRKAILNNIITFADGITPGQVVASDTADIPEVHLEAIVSFMARPEFALASPAVRDKFEKRRQFYMDGIGAQYPQSMPYPEDEAEMAQQFLQQGPESMPSTGGAAGVSR